MTLSTSSIFHFTNDKEKLKGILKTNFKVSYCKETLQFNNEGFIMHIPMVSFCDIPLSKVKNHIKSYGEYGIGLNKSWAVKNGLNPVLYFEIDSNLSDSFLSVVNSFIKTEAPLKNLTHPEKSLLNILRYAKNYEADLYRKNKNVIRRYRFYDEREWRYVPDFNNEFAMMLSIDEYGNSQLLNKESELLNGIELFFEPNDIKYIIIKNDDEISEFLDVFQKDKGSKYSYQDIQRLSTRIFTAEQIINDI